MGKELREDLVWPPAGPYCVNVAFHSRIRVSPYFILTSVDVRSAGTTCVESLSGSNECLKASPEPELETAPAIFQ